MVGLDNTLANISIELQEGEKGPLQTKDFEHLKEQYSGTLIEDIVKHRADQIIAMEAAQQKVHQTVASR